MRKEYDFSKGERGKFYCSDMKLNIQFTQDAYEEFIGEWEKLLLIHYES